METLFLIPLLAVALFFGLLVVLWLADSGFSYVVEALNTLEEDLHANAAGVREKLFRRAARKRVERRFAVAAGILAGCGKIDLKLNSCPYFLPDDVGMGPFRVLR